MRDSIFKVGDVVPTRNCGDVEITEIIDGTMVSVIFKNTGFERVCRKSDLSLGKVKDLLQSGNYGRYVGVGNYNSTEHTVAYNAWYYIFERAGVHENYIITTVDETWKDFQVFAKWFYENHVDGFTEIDKDLFGTNMYSPDTCVLLNRELNMLERNMRAPLNILEKTNKNGSVSYVSRFLGRSKSFFTRK